ncbi:MAG: peptidyl-prolyl cis-trans isomerase C, partial [Planctomycetota bacterium]
HSSAESCNPERDDLVCWPNWSDPLLPFEEHFMARASARHILVSTEQECLDIKEKLANGGAFDSLAKQHSSCPSGQSGGDLGEFGPGQMVKEFDAVVFNEDVGVVHGPVKTQFGFHLLEVTARS